MDFAFCFDGSLQVRLDGGAGFQLDGASFIGNFDTPYEITLTSQISILHVRFKAGGIYPLTKVPLANILNGELPIKDLINQGAYDVYQEMGEARTFESKVKILEAYLCKIYRSSDINYRLNQAINTIQQKKGILNIRDLSYELNTNYKSLERWFKAKVGLTPKKFSSITRFKNIVEDIDSKRVSSWMDLVVDYGFHDQSHFIKSFEEFSGLTPEVYLRKNQVSIFYNE